MNHFACRMMRTGALALCAALLGSACAATAAKAPVVLTVWHYYSGAQQQAFDSAVQEFNETEGAQQGIQVEAYNYGTVEELIASVLASANHEIGAAALPNIFSAYADTVYELDALGAVADLAPYLSAEEQALYLDGYLEEGRFSGADSLKLFPIAKATEILTVNATDLAPFAAATGITQADFSTMEGMTATAQKYYTWTDALTPDIANDGKAFFGRDAFANYMFVGAQQLGCELFQVEDGKPTLNFDRQVVRKLWDNYYVPMVAGWFFAENRFRTDDVKLGKIIACVGSSSSASFFPQEVVVSDTDSHKITSAAYPAPEFAGGVPYAVQQGAGMAVTALSDEETQASVEFLKWFTTPERNAAFAAASGYLPVTRQASTAQYLQTVLDKLGTGQSMQRMLLASVDTAATNTMYTPKAFANGSGARAILNQTMPDKAAADREAFVALLAAGTPYADALARFDTDESFEAWYADTLAQLQPLFA